MFGISDRDGQCTRGFQEALRAKTNFFWAASLLNGGILSLNWLKIKESGKSERG